MGETYLWVLFVIVAAAGQTARNAMQRELTARLGTIGATHVRFLFGFPFALMFLAGILVAFNASLPTPTTAFWPWVIVGAFAQILATGLMLAAMGERSFVVTIAYTKTEPIHVALFGLVFLGERLTPPLAIAILIATAGVMLMSWKTPAQSAGFRPALLGIVSGAMFGLSAVGYRGAILTLENANFVVAASFTLSAGLLIQATCLSAYLAIRDPKVFSEIARAWRPSMFAGFMGAFASQFWFLAFALASAASVRTLGLIEVLYAQAVSMLIFGQKTNAREALGMALVVLGVGLLLWSHGQ